MTDKNQCLTLCLFDNQGNTVAAWQQFWHGRVMIYGTEFDWLPFKVNGTFRGNNIGQAALTVELPNTDLMHKLTLKLLSALEQNMLKISLYEFNGGESIPPDYMTLLGMTRGQVVSATNDSLATIKWEIGTAINPAGASIPWRTATSRLIGAGITL